MHNLKKQTTALTRKKKDKQAVYILMIVLQCLIYGIGNPITKIAYESITPFWCLAFRFTLAALLMAVLAGRKAIIELKAVRIGNWMPSALCMAGAYILSNLALNLTDATTVGFLMSLPVLFVPVLAVFILHRPYYRKFLPIQLAAAAGLYLLCSNGDTFYFGLGEILALVTAVCTAGALVWSEKSLKSMSPVTISFVQITITAILSVTGAFLFERRTDLSVIQPAAWLVILYLAVFCSCISYLLQNVALLHIPSSLISLTQCTEPVFTAAAAFAVLGEHLSGMGWWGAALLLTCIVYGNYMEKKTDSNWQMKGDLNVPGIQKNK